CLVVCVCVGVCVYVCARACVCYKNMSGSLMYAFVLYFFPLRTSCVNIVCVCMCVCVCVCVSERGREGERERETVCVRSEEHTSELQSHLNLVCRLLLEKNK